MISRIPSLAHYAARVALKRISSGAPSSCSGSVYQNKSKLAVQKGRFFTRIAENVVVDFGCGEGSDAVELAGKGAKRVIGVDIREDVLETARQRALGAGVQDTCVFATSTNELAGVVISMDAFEHFADRQQSCAS